MTDGLVTRRMTSFLPMLLHTYIDPAAQARLPHLSTTSSSFATSDTITKASCDKSLQMPQGLSQATVGRPARWPYQLRCSTSFGARPNCRPSSGHMKLFMVPGFSLIPDTHRRVYHFCRRANFDRGRSADTLSSWNLRCGLRLGRPDGCSSTASPCSHMSFSEA